MIRNKVQSKIGAAMSSKLGDAVQSFTARRTETKPNKITEKVDVIVVATYQGRGIFPLSFTAFELESLSIPRTDTKAIVLQNECSDKPKEADEITFGGKVYTVINVKQDPVAATWTLQLRG